MKRKRHEPNLKRNEIQTKRNTTKSKTNLKRDETKRNAFTLALTGYDARALSVPVQRPGDGKSLSASEVYKGALALSGV